MPDWITDFVDATASIRSPERFRQWTAISTIAALLERRVYTSTDVRRLYPNLYVVLSGEPASGKTNSVREARKILAAISDLKLGPDNPTKASFLDELEDATRNMGHVVYHALTVICEEFGVFIKIRDDDLITDLTTLFDNPEKFTAPRRVSKSVSIEKPTLNILACATPAVLGKFPDSAWNEGFTSRVIFIWGVRPTDIRHAFRKRQDPELTDLTVRAAEFFTDLNGEFEWDEDAQIAFNDWYNNGMLPKPDYSRLEHYASRRDTHAMKLSMISAVSCGHGLNVTLSDFNRACNWLFEAENEMPNVFLSMTAPSDSKVMDDLHHYVYTEYSKVERDKRLPVPKDHVLSFLSKRVTSEKVDRILLLAEQTGQIRSTGFGWIPNPKLNGKG